MNTGGVETSLVGGSTTSLEYRDVEIEVSHVVRGNKATWRVERLLLAGTCLPLGASNWEHLYVILWTCMYLGT